MKRQVSLAMYISGPRGGGVTSAPVNLYSGVLILAKCSIRKGVIVVIMQHSLQLL